MSLFQMDFFIFMLVLVLVAGGICIIFASVAFSKSNAEAADEYLENKLEVLGSSVNEADEAISELNDMSKNMMKELDNKYQELLYLYNLIDEKQKGFVPAAASSTSSSSPAPVAAKKAMASINPKFARVLEMFETGKSIEDIAIEMDMGKGEVGLILNLGGGRKDA